MTVFFPSAFTIDRHEITTMEYEIFTLQDAQMIGRSRKIAFNNPSECQKFWGEYVERIVKPVYLEGRAPDEFQIFAGLSMRYDAVYRRLKCYV